MLNQRSAIHIKVLSLLILLFVVAGSATAAGYQRREENRIAASASDALSIKDRVEVFEEVWETIDEKYYNPTFNGVNWRAVRERYRPMVDQSKSDGDFYALLKRMVGELHDAHTRFHTPLERREREQLQALSAGIYIFDVQGQPVIISVELNSDAERAGVKPGMIVRTIDGRPVAERLAEAQSRIGGSSTDRAVRLRLYRKIIEGEPGTPLRLGLERADHSHFEVTLMRRIVPDEATVSYRRLPSGIGYIRLTLWKSPVHKQFKSALESLRDAPGIILDLRGNPGGEAAEVVKIASYFFNSRTSFGRFFTRSGKSVDLWTSRDDQIYKGPVAILVNEGSGSGSELFSGVMQEAGRAIVVGRQSCGCVLGISKFRKVKGGGELAVSELGYVSPRGQKFEGAGIKPDRAVALTIADLQHNRDLALDEAEISLRAAKATVSNERQ
ncbi:MAG TPA: S41 family peptidase [Blastocatellia bacterium]|nr:S41 family peptidase [Blastocatellia bacterium]